MVEVTVDAKPKPQLPYDPDVIPQAVRDRAAAVDALYKTPSTNGEQPQPSAQPPAADNSPEQLDLPLAEPAPQVRDGAPPQPAPAAPPAPHEDENSQSWKHRFLAMQGRYTASTKTIGEMQEQMTQLGNELLHTQRMVSNRPQQPPQQYQAPRYLTAEDESNYGQDLVDFTRRAAAEVAAQTVGPKLYEIEQQNAALQERLAREARRNLDQRVELAVPNYKEIDRDPRWHRWLLGVDTLSGRVRQTLLDEAISAAQAPRVISFFRGFLQEEQATGHIASAPRSQQPAAPREAAMDLNALAAPGRARPATGGDASVPLDKPIYTRAQIAQLYSQHRRGAYVGREAEWSRQELDFFAAQKEGRVR